jgi:hypothetical protein
VRNSHIFETMSAIYNDILAGATEVGPTMR